MALERSQLDRLEQVGGEGALILEDRACGECGYNVKGLQFGGKCPECGTPIVRKRRRSGEPALGDSPAGYLAMLSLGLTFVGGCGMAWVIWIFIGPVISVGVPPMAIVALSVAWCGATALILRERPFSKRRRSEIGGSPEWLGLRVVVGATQACSLGIALSVWMRLNGHGDIWLLVLGGSMLAVMVGWAPLSVYLSRLAYWANDDEGGDRFSTLAVWLGVTGGLGAFVVAPSWGFLVFMRWVGVMAIMALVPLSFWMFLTASNLGTTVRWAARNAEAARARDRRMAERAREEAARAAAERMRVGAGAGGGVEMTAEQRELLEEIERKNESMGGEGDEAVRRRVGQQHTIERSGDDDVEAFGLEEDGAG